MEAIDKFNEWALDVSLDPPCFVPYLRDTDEFVFGLNLVTAKCPGKLVCIIHQAGQDAVDAWCKANPDWHERFTVGSL